MSMDVFEAMRTTRAMRRLDPSKPVSDDDLWKILDAASRAASGGNSQPLRWIVVKDEAKRRRLGEIYKECWTQVGAMYRARGADQDPTTAKVLNSADHLGEHMGDAPVIVLPATKGQGQEASVFPAVQNLFLGARALGLGTTLTTVHLLKEADVKELLAIPDDVKTYAMIPIGYPTGRWGEAQRRPIEDVTYWDGWKATRPRG